MDGKGPCDSARHTQVHQGKTKLGLGLAWTWKHLTPAWPAIVALGFAPSPELGQGTSSAPDLLNRPALFLQILRDEMCH